MKKNKGGRPPNDIDQEKLKALMRLLPTLADTAAFFECSERTIERHIRKEFDLSFVEFREQNMVHTRLNLRRRAIRKAEEGDNTMLIWCMKNIDNWTDKTESRNINENVHRFDDMPEEELDKEIARLEKSLKK